MVCSISWGRKTCVTSECNNGLLRSFAVKLSLNLKSKDPFMKVGKNEEYRLSSSGYMRFAHVYMKLQKGLLFPYSDIKYRLK